MKDLTIEYSTTPSIGSTKINETTSAILQRIEEKNCASTINIGLMKAIVFGNGRMPHILVMAIEQVC